MELESKRMPSEVAHHSLANAGSQQLPWTPFLQFILCPYALWNVPLDIPVCLSCGWGSSQLLSVPVMHCSER